MADLCKKGHEGEIFYNTRNERECRECKRIAQRKYKENNLEKTREAIRAHYRRNIEKMKEKAAQKHDRKHFSGLREVVIERDGAQCVSCGITREEHREKYNKDITINHIDGNGTTKPYEEHNNSLENLETMCVVCHTAKDRKRVLALKGALYV
jgi:5-methylcytosine-specific restriction endonuclease McrA